MPVGFTSYTRAFMAGFHSHALLYALLIIMFAMATIASGVTGISLLLMEPVATLQLSLSIMILVLAGAAVLRVFTFVRRRETGSLVSALRHYFLQQFLPPDAAARILHGVIFMAMFYASFLFVKRVIPQMNPFQWDETFARLDAQLHLGSYPHEWLLPVLGSASAIFTIAVIYNLWFVVLMAFWFWQIFRSDDDQLRLQSLLALGLTWFVGTDVFGILFSSAGPCFFGRVTGGSDPYGPLMAHLAQANETLPVLSLAVQEQLWQAYITLHGPVAGISAMPSIHIASSVLFIFFGFGIARWLGWTMVAFASAIFLGSILLGWHYAIDGYAGVALGGSMWYFARFLIRRAASWTGSPTYNWGRI